MIKPIHVYNCIWCGCEVYCSRVKVACKKCHGRRGATGDRVWAKIVLSSLLTTALALAAENALRAAHYIP